MKKKYSLPDSMVADLNSTFETVKNNIGTLNYKIVPLDAIEFDPHNPRELAILREDLPHGPLPTDPLYDKKMEELESLEQTAETIKKYGVRNAVEIYKHGQNYRLIHGERRCLSSILAGKKEIPAKILDEKPTEFDIRLLQLIENIQREDLTLYDTLKNINQVITEYKKTADTTIEIDTPFLESLINRSKTQCFNFLTVLNAPQTVQELIKDGKIKSLEKAAIIVRTKEPQKREALLKMCLEGASLKQLKTEASVPKRGSAVSLSLEKKLKILKKEYQFL